MKRADRKEREGRRKRIIVSKNIRDIDKCHTQKAHKKRTEIKKRVPPTRHWCKQCGRRGLEIKSLFCLAAPEKSWPTGCHRRPALKGRKALSTSPLFDIRYHRAQWFECPAMGRTTKNILSTKTTTEGPAAGSPLTTEYNPECHPS